MLTPYSRSQFVERILIDHNGREFRVLFLVSLVNGEVIGRPVSVQPVQAQILELEGEQANHQAKSLPFFNTQKIADTVYVFSSAPIASPYVNLDSIITSQPTRAPSTK